MCLGVVRKCVALDGVTLRCLHSSAFSYNVWVKEPGTHTLEAWIEELGTGQRYATTNGMPATNTPPIRAFVRALGTLSNG